VQKGNTLGMESDDKTLVFDENTKRVVQETLRLCREKGYKVS
jgi:hypothetical protein